MRFGSSCILELKLLFKSLNVRSLDMSIIPGVSWGWKVFWASGAGLTKDRPKTGSFAFTHFVVWSWRWSCFAICLISLYGTEVISDSLGATQLARLWQTVGWERVLVLNVWVPLFSIQRISCEKSIYKRCFEQHVHSQIFHNAKRNFDM